MKLITTERLGDKLDMSDAIFLYNDRNDMFIAARKDNVYYFLHAVINKYTKNMYKFTALGDVVLTSDVSLKNCVHKAIAKSDDVVIMYNKNAHTLYNKKVPVISTSIVICKHNTDYIHIEAAIEDYYSKDVIICYKAKSDVPYYSMLQYRQQETDGAFGFFVPIGHKGRFTYKENNMHNSIKAAIKAGKKVYLCERTQVHKIFNV